MAASSAIDYYWMQYALSQAYIAALHQEVPIGAVLIGDNKVLGLAHNQPIRQCDPTAHAEILCLRQASRALQNYRLPNTTLYVTVEPCTMCFGALIHARVQRLVFGASEPRAGAVGTAISLHQLSHYNHRIAVHSGVLAEDCAQLLRDFFRRRRSSC